MTGKQRALLLAGLHLLLVAGLGAKLLIDRATRPRYWVKAAPVDPDLPIRGRYVSLRVEVPVTGAALPPQEPRPKGIRESEPWPPDWQRYRLQVELEAGPKGLLARTKGNLKPRNEFLHDANLNAELPERMRGLPESAWTVVLDEAVPFFIPEHVPDPSRLKPGEELWVEVTLPKKGPLRPIRLAIKKNGGLTPVSL